MNVSSNLVLWLLTGILLSAPARAANAGAAWPKIAEELIRSVEKTDTRTSEKKAEWEKVKSSLKAASLQASTAAGFRLSALHILDKWDGRGFRILDDSQAQYYALAPEAPRLHDTGAWFAQKGAKWYVKQTSRRTDQIFRRGDALAVPSFHPVHSWTDAPTQKVRVLAQPLATAEERTLKVKTTSLGDWALAETQAASAAIPQGGKRLCQEKAWLWLSRPVSIYLASKIKFAQDNCDALLVDLRDTFGEGKGAGASNLPLKGSHSIPVVVLVNEETREGGVSLALQLKDELNAWVIGEPTASLRMPLEQQMMKEIPWLLLSYETTSGSLLPDETVNDVWMFSGGQDQIYEAGFARLRKNAGL